jgi:VanZ family protein
MTGALPLLRKIAFFIGWLLMLVVAALSLVPAALRPETAIPHHLEHFAVFAATGFALGFGYGRRPVTIMLALVGFAGAIELAQMLLPDRHARLADFLVDALAVCAGAALSSLTHRAREPRPQSTPLV